MTKPAFTTENGWYFDAEPDDPQWTPAEPCRLCGSADRLQPDPAEYHKDAVTTDDAALLCTRCRKVAEGGAER